MMRLEAVRRYSADADGGYSGRLLSGSPRLRSRINS